jgi:hypothetical protein
MAKPTLAELLAATTKAQIDVLILDANNATNTNCTGVMTRCKNCDGCADCTDCNHLTTCANCIDSSNSLRCNNCVNSDSCVDCNYMVNANTCYLSTNCSGPLGNRVTKLYLCRDCIECDRCIGEVGGRNLRNSVCGVQLTTAQFNTLWTLIAAAYA